MRDLKADWKQWSKAERAIARCVAALSLISSSSALILTLAV